MTVSETADPFARQRLIEGWSQHRLSAATAIVIGVGALGNEVAKNLALAGVGRLLLCDPDVVDMTNLSRSALFTSADAGRAKVDAAAGALARLSQATSVVARQATLTAGAGLGELAAARLVLGCLDSRRSRQELLGRCALAGVPLVDGGTGPWSGEVRVRISLDAGCYACSLTPYERGESDTPRSCAEILPPGAEPAFIATTSLVAAWMTVAALRSCLRCRSGTRGCESRRSLDRRRRCRFRATRCAPITSGCHPLTSTFRSRTGTRWPRCSPPCPTPVMCTPGRPSQLHPDAYAAARDRSIIRGVAQGGCCAVSSARPSSVRRAARTWPTPIRQPRWTPWG